MREQKTTGGALIRALIYEAHSHMQHYTTHAHAHTHTHTHTHTNTNTHTHTIGALRDEYKKSKDRKRTEGLRVCLIGFEKFSTENVRYCFM